MTIRALMQLFKKLSAESGRMSRGVKKVRSHPGTPTGVKGDMPGVTKEWTGFKKDFSPNRKDLMNFPTRGTPSGTFTPGSPEWRRVMERKVKDKVARIDSRNRARDSISAMRKDPGIGAGLQKLDSRAYSALNTGGRGPMGAGRSGKPGRPLQYESNPANTFTNLMRTDKGFQRFVLDQVGPEKVSTVLLNPEIRRRLMGDYFRTVRRGADNFPPHIDMGTPATTDDIMKMFGGGRNRGAKEIDNAWNKHLDDLYSGE